MSRTSHSRIIFCSYIAAVLSLQYAQAAPLGSAITYQGQLKNSGSPANGNFNMSFALFDAASAGTQVGPTLTFDGIGGNPAPVSVSNGLFTVQLDFGPTSYNGDKRWLNIAVNGTPLSPRQELTAAPYARFSTAPWATSGNNISNTNSSNVGIGTASPTSKLDVAGTINMSGLQLTTAPGAGRLLTSDVTGTGTWQPLAPIGLSGLSQDLQNQLLPLTSANTAAWGVAGTATTVTGPYSIAVSGGYAYVVNLLGSSLQIFNVSDPTNPALVGSAGTASSPNAVAVSDGYAYVAAPLEAGGLLQIFNVSNPASPTLAGSIGAAFAISVAVSGSYAYVTGSDPKNPNSGQLRIINVSNPASPTLTGSIVAGSGPWPVAVSGDYAFVADFDLGLLQVFNVSNPASPTLAGSVGTGVNPISIVVSGGYAYVVNYGSNTLQVFNVSNPASPTLAGTATTETSPSSIAVSGSYAWVTNQTSNSLQIFNVSNPASPTLTGSGGTMNSPTSVALSNGYPCVVNYNSDSLQVFAAMTQFNTGATFVGNVGIGTASPLTKLHVSTNTDTEVSVQSTAAGGRRWTMQSGTTGTFQIVDRTAVASRLLINPNGNVGIGTTSPSQKLHVVGNICATGTIGACSDARFKTRIAPLDNALSLVEKLRPVEFDWKRDEFRDHEFAEGRQIGFIAQEVEKILPQVVSTGTDSYKSVDYGRLTPVLVEAVKEMKREKDMESAEHQQAIRALQGENAELRARLERLETLMSASRK